jgi:hypothetical protein
MKGLSWKDLLTEIYNISIVDTYYVSTMNLPKFHFPSTVLALALVLIILLGGSVFWFSRIPPYERPFGILAATCYYEPFFTHTSTFPIVSISKETYGAKIKQTIDAQYLAYYTNNGLGYCGQIDLHTHMDYIQGTKSVGNSEIGLMQSSISNGVWLSGRIYIPDLTHSNYQLGTGLINVSHPCKYVYSTTFYSYLDGNGEKGYTDSEWPEVSESVCSLFEVPGLY